MARQRIRIDPSDYKARFDGLMSKHQRTLYELEQLKAQLAQQGTGASPDAPEGSQGPSRGSQGMPGEGASPAPSGRQDLSQEMAERARQAAEAHRLRQAQDQEDQELAEAVMAARLEKVQKAALERWPAIAPLIDHVSGEDEAGYMEAARQLNEALGGAEAGPAPAPEGPPVLAGNPPMYQPTAQERVQEAIDIAKSTGNWSQYFRVKDAQARGE
jgi:hypothetical protein